MQRQDLIDHPEKYDVRAYDVFERKFIVRAAETIRPDDLLTLDVAMVIPK